MVPYNEQVLSVRTVPIAKVHLFDAAKKLLVERGYELIDEDLNLGYLEVSSPVDSSFGMYTREHWIVLISAEQVSVERSLQEREKGHWLEYAFVDRSYSYASENELLHSITGAAGQLARQGKSEEGVEVAAKVQAPAGN